MYLAVKPYKDLLKLGFTQPLKRKASVKDELFLGMPFLVSPFSFSFVLTAVLNFPQDSSGNTLPYFQDVKPGAGGSGQQQVIITIITS